MQTKLDREYRKVIVKIRTARGTGKDYNPSVYRKEEDRLWKLHMDATAAINGFTKGMDKEEAERFILDSIDEIMEIGDDTL